MGMQDRVHTRSSPFYMRARTRLHDCMRKVQQWSGPVLPADVIFALQAQCCLFAGQTAGRYPRGNTALSLHSARNTVIGFVQENDL